MAFGEIVFILTATHYLIISSIIIVSVKNY